MIDRKTFFDAVRASPFKGSLDAGQVRGMTAILDVFERDYNWPDLRWLAYALATTFHETATTMQPITEMGSAAYLRSRRYWPYIGRGYVQLTWDYNYRKMGSKLGVDLMAPNEERALDHEIAAKVMFVGMRDGDFTRFKLADYFNDTMDDPEGARRIINGTDRAQMVAGYHELFLHALKQADKPLADPALTPGPEYMKRSEVAAMLRRLADQIERL